MSSPVYYRLADIVLQVDSDFSYRWEESYMSQFLLDRPEEPDFVFTFRQVDDIAALQRRAPHFLGETLYYHYYQDGQGREYCFHVKDRYYHAVTVLEQGRGTCYYLSQGWLAEKIRGGYHLENFFWLERILQQFGCMVLHSCHIQKEGRAILFTAPSGTGKSTQGDLWARYNGAEVINGDRTAIRRVNGVWTAYGLPFCGTSGIHENRQAPIRAIVVLRQHPENRAARLGGREAFSALYSELTVNAWSRRAAEEAMDWVSGLMAEVPVYRFLCTKEPEAVSTLEDALLREERREQA